MKKILVTTVAMGALLVSASLAAAANGELVTNGSFSGGLNGWTATPGVNAFTSQDYVNNAGGVGDTGTGLFAAFGAGNNLTGTISQVLKTVVGATYTLNFDFGAFGSPGGNAQGIAWTVGSSVNSYPSKSKFLTNDLGNEFFTSFSTIFTATSTSTKLSFTGLGNTVNADTIIDNVSVQGPVAVPGPEAGAGLGALAMAGMAFWMKRRNKNEVSAA